MAGRVGRHRAGERLAYAQTTQQTLAETAVHLLGAEVTWPLIPTHGAERAARLITQLLPHDQPEEVRVVRAGELTPSRV